MLCVGLQGALAGNVDEGPEGRFDEAPRKQKAAEGRLWRLGDAERRIDDAERRDSAEAEDNGADEDVVGDGVV